MAQKGARNGSRAGSAGVGGEIIRSVVSFFIE